MLLDHRRPTVFLPADPPREGRLALHDTWQPDAETLADGRVALGEFGAIRVWRNRITCGPAQLRLGPDGQWYRPARSGTGWNLDAPDPDPAVLLTPDASTVTL